MVDKIDGKIVLDDEHTITAMILRSELKVTVSPPGSPTVRLQLDHEHPLQYWREDFMYWNGRHYVRLSEPEINAEIAQFLNDAVVVKIDKKGKEAVAKYKTSTRIVNEVKAQLSWLPGMMLPTLRDSHTDKDWNKISYIPCRNGLLDIETGTMRPHDPSNLVFNTTQFDYEPNLPVPQHWMNFLYSLWPTDDGKEGGAIACLQEIMGYLLSGDGRMQKIFLFIGPIRCGKGTIQHVLRKLLGAGHTTGINSKGFANDFGLQQMIDKSIMFLPDQRNMRGAANLTQEILTISGQDPVTINRKNKPLWEGVLPTRIVILTNDIPHFPDASGAVASRFIPLVFTESWLGREDLELADKLEGELPQIMTWAIEGLKRLRKRSRFILTPAGEDMLQKIYKTAAPDNEVFEEIFAADPDGFAIKMDSYEVYRTEAQRRGHNPCAYQKFCTRVEQYFQNKIAITTGQPRIGNPDNKRVWYGITLTSNPLFDIDPQQARRQRSQNAWDEAFGEDDIRDDVFQSE